MSLLEKFKKISTIALDVDGVLTDGTLLLLDDGQMMRKMNIKDGYALQLAVKKGYRVLVISGGQSLAVELRLKKLGVQDIFLGVENKAALLDEYRQQHGLDWEEILFMGDDIPDIAVMQKVGLPCAPLDAASEVQSIATYISRKKGGEGCVRDVLEMVMKLRGDWQIDLTVKSR
ncbi:MAG TPA: HAD hydrolase family protein [Flavihumibacter sp.]|jgi:3-deoxy-D-manno-octulosonate 8-phosphate phosphatase (KDO 8-P phosphatase)